MRCTPVLAIVAALALAGAISTGFGAADGAPVRFGARVVWIAAETMVVSTDDGQAIGVDLSQVAQDEYQRLAPDTHVIVTGALDGNRIAATSIESLEP